MSLSRDGFCEIVVTGELVVTGLHSFSSFSGIYPTRSLLKPFQFLATTLAKKTFEDRFYMCLGSISANHDQINCLRTWYDIDHSAPISALKLNPAYPMDENYRVLLKQSHQPPHVLFHTCFSKHIAIIETCLEKGWDVNTYNSVDHPYHRELLLTLSNVLGQDLSQVHSVTDGCGLPSPCLPLKTIALLYQRLATPLPLFDRMCERPDWIGGPERLDTKIMNANPKVLVAKEGADGLFGIGIKPNTQFPSGLGIAVKLTSGFQPRHMTLILNRVLTELGFTQVNETTDHTIRFHFSLQQSGQNWIDISPTLSEKSSVWPGDVTFERSVSLSQEKGHHLSLSSIRTTLHVGAHTDAPNHCIIGPGIDAVAISPYVGLCQVVEVTKKPASNISPLDLVDPIRAPRILFKTLSFNRNQFNCFVALSIELIEYLTHFDVILVGVDTPSVDAFDSKTLDTHKKIFKSGIAILEGIVLDSVSPGLYELISLPLRIKDGDASPVRAVLRQYC